MTKNNISNQNNIVQVADISDQSFNEEVLKSSKPVLIDFYANWCKPCQNFLPIVNEVAGELSDTLKTVKINIDENPQITSELGVRSIPALFIFENGKQVVSASGSRSKSQLVDWINNSLIK
jgi:thioredoxin 1